MLSDTDTIAVLSHLKWKTYIEFNYEYFISPVRVDNS